MTNFILFYLFLIFSLWFSRGRLWVPLFIISVFVGLRPVDVGNDTIPLLNEMDFMLENPSLNSLNFYFKYTISYLIHLFSIDILGFGREFTLLIYSFIYYYFVYKTLQIFLNINKSLLLPIIFITVIYFTPNIFLQSMNHVRQLTAGIIITYAILRFNNNPIKILPYFIISILFHVTSLIFLPILFLAFFKKVDYKSIIVIFSLIFLIFFNSDLIINLIYSNQLVSDFLYENSIDYLVYFIDDKKTRITSFTSLYFELLIIVLYFFDKNLISILNSNRSYLKAFYLYVVYVVFKILTIQDSFLGRFTESFEFSKVIIFSILILFFNPRIKIKLLPLILFIFFLVYSISSINSLFQNDPFIGSTKYFIL